MGFKEFEVEYMSGAQAEVEAFENARIDMMIARSVIARTGCPDCGEPGEIMGHMGCQYPGRAGGMP